MTTPQRIAGLLDDLVGRRDRMQSLFVVDITRESAGKLMATFTVCAQEEGTTAALAGRMNAALREVASILSDAHRNCDVPVIK